MAIQIGIGVLVLLVVLVAFIATRPSNFRIERSALIGAPEDVVFGMINDFHQWGQWSPWDKFDPDMKKTYEGPAAGPGAIYAWTGNNKVGMGRLTLLDSKPGAFVSIKLEFFKPFVYHESDDLQTRAVGGRHSGELEHDGEKQLHGQGILALHEHGQDGGQGLRAGPGQSQHRGASRDKEAQPRRAMMHRPGSIFQNTRKEETMSGVRVLVGTRKGAFVLTSDGKREQWDVSGPHFGGWEIYHLKGSPVDPSPAVCVAVQRLVRAVIQRSTAARRRQDVGWPVGNKFVYDGVPGTHQWYDGTPHPWEFKRVWHLEPSLTDPDTVYAGVEDAALFRSTDGAQTWRELSGTARPRLGAALAAGRRRLVPAHDPSGSERTRIGSSSPSRPRARSVLTMAARRGGRSTAGLHSRTFPTRMPRSATAYTASPCTPSSRRVLFMQKHWDVMRSENAGDSWQEVSGNLPSDFGFVIDVHAHEPETIYVVPIKSDSRALSARRASCASTAVARAETSGKPLTKGLPQKQLLRQRTSRCHGRGFTRFLRRVFRHHRRAGVRVGRCRRQLDAHCFPFTGGGFRRGADAGMIRILLPHHLRTLAQVGGEVKLAVEGLATQRSVLDALEARYPVLRGTIRDHVTHKRRPMLRFFACQEDLSNEPPDAPLPEAVVTGIEPFWVVGAIAGG